MGQGARRGTAHLRLLGRCRLFGMGRRSIRQALRLRGRLPCLDRCRLHTVLRRDAAAGQRWQALHRECCGWRADRLAAAGMGRGLRAAGIAGFSTSCTSSRPAAEAVPASSLRRGSAGVTVWRKALSATREASSACSTTGVSTGDCGGRMRPDTASAAGSGWAAARPPRATGMAVAMGAAERVVRPAVAADEDAATSVRTLEPASLPSVPAR